LGSRSIKLPAAILAAILLIGAAIAYVTAPPQGAHDYRERAAATAETLVSQLETARLWAENEEAGKALRTTVLVGFEQTDEDADAAVSQFEAYEPAAGTARLRHDLAALGAETTAALAKLRIAAQQERWDEVAALSRPLPALSNRLRALAERTEP